MPSPKLPATLSMLRDRWVGYKTLGAATDYIKALEHALAATGEEVLGEYAGNEGRRYWWNGGTWLRPGDRVVVRYKK